MAAKTSHFRTWSTPVALPVALVALAAAAAAPPAAYGQERVREGFEVDPGTLVRVWLATHAPGGAPAARHTLQGTVEDASGDTLRLRAVGDGTPLAVPVEAIRRLQVSAGQKGSAGRGALIGAGAGGLLGGVIAFADTSHCKEWCIISPGTAFVGGFALGALPGALVGALIGSGIKTERWR